MFSHALIGIIIYKDQFLNRVRCVVDRVWRIISRILSLCDIDTQSFWLHSMKN